MAACLFFVKAKKQRAIEQGLREELLHLYTPRLGIENYPTRKAFATHLPDSHSSTFSDLTNGFSRKYARGVGGLGSSFAGYVPLASQNPYPGQL